MKKLVQYLGYSLMVKISALFKISCMTGSYALYLAGPAIIAPLAGAFGGISGSFAVLFFRMVFYGLMYKAVSLSFLALCIPGFFASLYWASRSVVIRLFVPVACMVLFVMHPVGSQAFIYSFYWLIPIGLFFIPRKSLFLEALGSTFVAHAVGSTIWLYTVPMTAAMWLNLIPLVAVERLLCAYGMVFVYRLFLWVSSLRPVFAVDASSKRLTV